MEFIRKEVGVAYSQESLILPEINSRKVNPDYSNPIANISPTVIYNHHKTNPQANANHDTGIYNTKFPQAPQKSLYTKTVLKRTGILLDKSYDNEIKEMQDKIELARKEFIKDDIDSIKRVERSKSQRKRGTIGNWSIGETIGKGKYISFFKTIDIANNSGASGNVKIVRNNITGEKAVIKSIRRPKISNYSPTSSLSSSTQALNEKKMKNELALFRQEL